MLLTLSTTDRPATDLGYLLHNHPDRCQSFALSFEEAHVVYLETGDERCMACLLLDVDPVGMVRGRSEWNDGLLDQYVGDRPYVASSLMSVAVAQVFGSALVGQSKERAELVDVPISPAPPLQPLAAAPNLTSAKTVANRATAPSALEHLTHDVAGLAQQVIADRVVDALLRTTKDPSAAEFAGWLLDRRAHAESAELQRPSRSFVGAALAHRQAALERAVDGAVSEMYGGDELEIGQLPLHGRHKNHRLSDRALA